MLENILMIIVLFLGALLFIAAEVCTPMFGLVAAAGLGCLIGMVYLCFTRIGPTFGVVVLVALVFVIPIYIWAIVKYLPRLPLGRILQLRAKPRQPGEAVPEAKEEESLVGKVGIAETPLRPAGAIRVGNKRLSATAEAGFIEKGATVKIVRTSGLNVVVREVKDERSS